MRPGTIFVALCMVLIAGSAGGMVYLAVGADVGAAITVAVAVLTGLAVYNTTSSRQRAMSPEPGQIADLMRASTDLARQMSDISRRQAAVEKQAEAMFARTRAFVDPLTIEMGEIGTLVKELAETIAAHENALAALAQSPPTRADPFAIAPPSPLPADAREAAPASTSAPAPAVSAAPMQAKEPPPALAAPAPEPPLVVVPAPAAAPAQEAAPVPAAGPAAAAVRAAADDKMLTALNSAIESSRVDLYLQPIVTLPQRKVRYYEAMSRLRTDAGEVVPAADFIGAAERGGLMPKIDNLVIFRCVQVIRRLLVKNREIGLFCNLSGSTLIDGAVFPQLIEFLEANRAIAPAVVFEFTQNFLRMAGPIENEAFAALAERGFRFSLDNVTDLRLEPRELAARGFRFIKIPAGLLLGRVGTATADIHPADLSDLLGRFGIDLIAERIESEGTAVDLLDYDVRFGQGFLFSPPRPVKAEALQGIAERSDLAVREAPRVTAPATGNAEPAPELDAGKRASGLARLVRGRV